MPPPMMTKCCPMEASPRGTSWISTLKMLAGRMNSGAMIATTTTRRTSTAQIVAEEW